MADNSGSAFLSSLPRANYVDTQNLNGVFAARMQNLISAATAATGSGATLTSGYRSPEHQAQIYANYTQRPVQYGGETYTPNGRSGIAARPGNSEHQLGMAVDIAPTGAAYQWMVSHASEYGIEAGALWSGSQHDPPHFELPPADKAAALAGSLPMPPGSDVQSPDPAPVSPLPPPAWYGINASGSPDDRSLDPNYYPPSYTPVPLAPIQMNISGSPDDRDTGLPFDASTPINVAPPATPVVTAPSGNTYVAGDVYQTADGASFRANSDGSFTKVANTPRQTTPIQLLLDSQAAGAQQNLANTVNAVQNVAQTAGSAVDKAGDFFKSLFSGGAPAAAVVPNSSGSPDDRGSAPFSYSTPVAMNSSGSPDDRDPDPSVGVTTWQSLLGVPTPSVGTTPVPGLPNPYATSSGPFNYSGSPDDRQAAEDAANSGARQTNSGIAGTAQLPAGVTPPGAASAEAQAVQANGGSHSSSPATSDDGGWSSLLTAVGDAPFSSPAPTMTAPTAAPATTHGTDEAPTYSTKTEIEQVANPAYSAWLKDQNSAIYGVEGVDTPSLDANGNVVTPSSYVGATAPRVPAPPKTIAKPITVKIPVRTAAPPAPVHAVAPISPIASTNGYTYVPNGKGGYTRVGVVNPSLTPSQQYAAAAAPALNDGNPNGAAGMGSSNPNVHSNGSLV